MLVEGECFTSSHSGSDLELSAIWKWLSSIAVRFLIEDPTLAKSVVAVLVDDVSSVVV